MMTNPEDSFTASVRLKTYPQWPHRFL